MRLLKIIKLVIFLFAAQQSFAQLTVSNAWTEYMNFEGIKIEYQYAPCNTSVINNQVLVLLKYSNTTNEEVSLSWNVERWFDNNCSNCNSTISNEESMSITLSPNQTKTGNCTTLEYKERYIFSNFIDLCPGMLDVTLTSFEFKNLTRLSDE